VTSGLGSKVEAGVAATADPEIPRAGRCINQPFLSVPSAAVRQRMDRAIPTRLTRNSRYDNSLLTCKSGYDDQPSPALPNAGTPSERRHYRAMLIPLRAGDYTYD